MFSVEVPVRKSASSRGEWGSNTVSCPYVCFHAHPSSPCTQNLSKKMGPNILRVPFKHGYSVCACVSCTFAKDTNGVVSHAPLPAAATWEPASDRATYGAMCALFSWLRTTDLWISHRPTLIFALLVDFVESRISVGEGRMYICTLCTASPTGVSGKWLRFAPQ